MKKNRFKVFAFVIPFLLTASLLAGCTTGSKSDYAFKETEFSTAEDNGSYYGYSDGGGYSYNEAEYYDSSSGYGNSKENTDYYDNTTSDLSRKLIKRVSLTLETLEFDKSVGMINDFVQQYHGYIESSSIRNNDYYETYYKNNSSRTASYVIRIPNNLVDGFVSATGNIGNIISNSTNTEDITLGYLDVESRAKALEIQQERLLSLLEQATTIDEIISLEDRLSQVTYELESKESTLRNYDNLVSYSTVSISINEVTKITEPEPETMGERIAAGFTDSIEDITEGLKNFVVWLVVNLPYIIVFLIIVAIAVVIVLLLIRLFKKLCIVKYRKDQVKLQKKREAYEKQQASLQASDSAQHNAEDGTSGK